MNFLEKNALLEDKSFLDYSLEDEKSEFIGHQVYEISLILNDYREANAKEIDSEFKSIILKLVKVGGYSAS